MSTNCLCMLLIATKANSLLWHTNKINNNKNKVFLSLHQWTPLHIAAKQGHQDMVEYLIGKKASMDSKDSDEVSVCEEDRLNQVFN